MKTSSLIKNAILFAIIAFLGYTFINKLLKLDSFALNIIKTNVFDGIWTYVAVAYALVSELACIVTLIFKERIGKILTLAVILSYTVYILYLWFNNLYEVCGCGGILNGLEFHWHFGINVVLITTLLYLNVYEEKN